MRGLDQLRREIDAAWRVYRTSPDNLEVDQAYELWCILVGQHDALKRDRDARERIRRRRD